LWGILDRFALALGGLCEAGLAVKLRLRDGTLQAVVLVAVRDDGPVVRTFDGVGATGEEFSIDLDEIAEVRVLKACRRP